MNTLMFFTYAACEPSSDILSNVEKASPVSKLQQVQGICHASIQNQHA